jgi:GT2 family glycosyltransferase
VPVIHDSAISDPTTPAVSIVIPTHNRLPCLQQCLNALTAQDFDPGRMEVIVVADGCSDGTEVAIRESRWPYELNVLSQPPSGASIARNRGAAAASAPLLVFLDDDVIPSPGLVAAHVNAHAAKGRCAVVGPYPLPEPCAGDYLAEELYLYWERKIQGMAVEGHRADFRDIVSGNLSLPAETFASLGGFSPLFDRLEDYEFGVRIFAAGVHFVFAADAHALHLETTDLNRSLGMTRRVGRAEVLLANLHPHVFPHLRLARRDRLPYWLAFRAPRLGQLLARGAPGVLALAQRMRVRRVWRKIYGRLKVYWYWRGVADGVEDYSEWLRRFTESNGAQSAQ